MELPSISDTHSLWLNAENIYFRSNNAKHTRAPIQSSPRIQFFQHCAFESGFMHRSVSNVFDANHSNVAYMPNTFYTCASASSFVFVSHFIFQWQNEFSNVFQPSDVISHTSKAAGVDNCEGWLCQLAPGPNEYNSSSDVPEPLHFHIIALVYVRTQKRPWTY